MPGANSPAAGSSSHRALGLLSLLELSNEVTARQDVFEIAEVALFNLMGHFGCSRGALWLVSEDPSRDTVLVRTQGVPAPIAQGLGAAWSGWFGERGAGMMEPIIVDRMADLGPPVGRDLAEQSELVLLAPLTVRRKLVGLFALGKRVGGGDFGLMELEVLQASLNVIAVAIDNATLFNRQVENNRGLRRSNQRLLELDRLKSEFISNMNHELRTPLTIMIAYLDSLLDAEEEKGSPHFERLRIVRDQARHLSTLVQSVLDFSELREDRAAIETRRGDLREDLMRHYEERRPGIIANLRDLTFSCPEDSVPALFDREQVLRIVDALLDNAAKFTQRGTRIQLRVETEPSEEGGRVRVDVADDGAGIPPDRLEHVFDSFRQGDGSGTREHGGMGLGLALSRELAVKMGGDLSVATEAGRGTVFSLRLPAA